jgi:hypothetical protein
MYPQGELIRLAAHKVALRRDIALRRVQCIEAVTRVAQPLEWLDRALAFWRRLSPLTKFAALPLGWFVQRAVFPRLKILGPLLRWAPLVMNVVRGVRAAARNRSGSPAE